MSHVTSTEYPNFAKKADIIEAVKAAIDGGGGTYSFCMRLLHTDLDLLSDKSETTASNLVPTAGGTLAWL